MMTTGQHNPSARLMNIRLADVSDAPALLQVIREAYSQYAGRLDPPSSIERLSLARLEQALAEVPVLVADRNGGIVGCVFYQVRADHVYLYRLGVVPRARRQRVGWALVQKVEEKAREHQLSAVRLAVRLALSENCAYYRALGYRTISLEKHEGYLEPTFRVMEKALEPGA